ncbi:MAG: hypothetical protein UT66_C0030G0008 [candidate division CPR2 bacterium GW2011_GWC1_39_9]|uniref:Acyltransferase 3 domain-containing protein n=1 Tax=candidate division CPR2 bacterium GW2011_GWC2_39_10 TaxID=1618345 RepID=A0A0G0P6B3_UNCC2|nr:MAG: hypothetical protein UT18_C0017G0009 [candidate division CPR2 bacterium GW2011_GWC2_39_10]KKR34042.1 MAG: hypothetical protein UT66_C0030G0008 [candidate division CPR2 bacterium GW2011_GWC1_39_9]
MSEQEKRFYLLDLLRGLAVFLMVLSHTVYFYHNGTSPFLLGLENFGNTVCFITFLVVSGAASYLAYFKDGVFKRERKNKIVKRLKMLVLSYWVLAFFVTADQLVKGFGLAKWKIILDILTFRNLPSYTEYIPPFIIYTLLLILMPSFFEKIVRKTSKVLLYSAVFYLAGFVLYLLPSVSFFAPWKALLSGANGFYRFPIFQYMPVFLLGLFWGKKISETKGLVKKEHFVLATIYSLIILEVVLIIAGAFLNGNLDFILLRWPPSITFLGIGLGFAYLSALGLYRARQLTGHPILRDFLLVLGQNAFALFWTHIFILQLYQMAGGAKVDNIFVFFFLVLLTFVSSLALATFIPFNFKFNLTFIKGSHEEQEELIEKETLMKLGEEVYEEIVFEENRIKNFFFPHSSKNKARQKLVKKRHMMAGSLVLLLITFAVFPSVLEEREKAVKSATSSVWFSDEFAYRQKIIVKNGESFASLLKGKNIGVNFDHASLIKEKKSLKNGTDLRLVYWDGSNFNNVIFWLNGPLGSSQAPIIFEVAESIAPGQEDGNYFLYYGNAVAENRFKNDSKIKRWESKYEVSFEQESSYPLLMVAEKIWNLKEKDKNLTLPVSLKTDQEFLNPAVTYEIMGQDINGKFTLGERNLFQESVNISELLPGKYQIRATIKEADKTYLSQKCGFYVSSPLYVAWTIDWEGYDVADTYLNALGHIADKHDAKLTNLFNPRIYTASSIAENRKNHLTNWVRSRNQKKGDEIGLHLHMHYDFVAEAGVEPKRADKWPNWGDIYNDGYSVLTSNYTKDELVKIYKKAFEYFDKMGLGRPTTYRAGGWFASGETLKALEEVGIKADTSGRTKYEFGYDGYKKQQGFWDLSESAQPYFPSKTDQNKTGSDNLNILEVPNNGADSFWFKAEDMIRRFNENYNGGILDNIKQVTYLSHPQWFNKSEQERMDKVLTYVDDFKNDTDDGPVVYVTSKDIYTAWYTAWEGR